MRPLILVVCSLLVLPAAAAFHSSPLPLLASGGGSGAGWAAVKLVSNGGSIDFEVTAHGDGSGGASAGVIFYRNGQPQFMLTLSGAGSESGILVDVHAGSGVDLTYGTRTTSGSSGLMGGAVTLTNVPAGTYHAAGWASGAVGDWAWEARGDDSVAAGSTSGSNTFFATTGDFSGLASARAAAGPGVRANVATDFAFASENSVVGIFFPAFYDAGVITATTPTGEQTCTCVFFNTPPGDYALHLTGAGTNVFEVYFTGADIALPA